MINGITYRDLKDIVVNWIITNCSNITDYDGMHDCVKNGMTFKIGEHKGNSYKEVVTYTIQSPLNGPTSITTVNNDMDLFYSSIGSPDGEIPENKFYEYINDLVLFCCTKLGFITSQYANGVNNTVNPTDNVKYLIYFQENNDFSNKIYIDSSSLNSYIIKAKDANMLWKNIIDMLTKINGYIRVVRVGCSFELSKNH